MEARLRRSPKWLVTFSVVTPSSVVRYMSTLRCLKSRTREPAEREDGGAPVVSKFATKGEAHHYPLPPRRAGGGAHSLASPKALRRASRPRKL